MQVNISTFRKQSQMQSCGVTIKTGINTKIHGNSSVTFNCWRTRFSACSTCDMDILREEPQSLQFMMLNQLKKLSISNMCVYLEWLDMLAVWRAEVQTLNGQMWKKCTSYMIYLSSQNVWKIFWCILDQFFKEQYQQLLWTEHKEEMWVHRTYGSVLQ